MDIGKRGLVERYITGLALNCIQQKIIETIKANKVSNAIYNAK